MKSDKFEIILEFPKELYDLESYPAFHGAMIMNDEELKKWEREQEVKKRRNKIEKIINGIKK